MGANRGDLSHEVGGSVETERPYSVTLTSYTIVTSEPVRLFEVRDLLPQRSVAHAEVGAEFVGYFFLRRRPPLALLLAIRADFALL